MGIGVRVGAGAGEKLGSGPGLAVYGPFPFPRTQLIVMFFTVSNDRHTNTNEKYYHIIFQVHSDIKKAI